MLTGLKVSSPTCKCVNYRPEHNAKGGPMVIKMSKMAHFLYLMNLNERSYLALSENVMDYWVLIYHYQMSNLENTGFRYFLLPQQVFLYFHL